MATADQLLEIEDGPWNGQVDSISPTAKEPGKYDLGQNIYPLDPALGDGVVGRPGVRQLGAILGTVGNRRGQGTFQFSKTNGAEYTVQITGGKFYTLNWITEVWTEVLTAANLAAAAGGAVVLDPNVKFAFLTFNDLLIVSDGVNKLWSWNGTTGGGVTLLTNSEAMYGQIRNYYARIFGISAANPDTILWSETDTPNTGYRLGGFNNAWSLRQTNPQRLYSIITTEDAIYCLRARSGTTIRGIPGPSFSSNGTKESLSDTIGTVSPFTTIMHDVNVMALDADAHPQMLRPGGAGFIPLWRQFRETTRRISKDPAFLAKCMTVYYPPLQVLLVALPDSGANECNMLLVYDAKGAATETGWSGIREPVVPTAIWRGWDMTTLAVVKNQNGQPYLLHSDQNGYVYLHGNPDDAAPWDDNLATGTVAIEHILELQPLGYSVKKEKIFDRIDISGRSLTPMTLEISATTPRGKAAAQIIVLGQSFLGFDSGIFDDPSTVFDPAAITGTLDTHGSVGLDLEARWIKPKIRHQTLGEQFGITALTVAAFATDNDPAIP